MTGSARFVACLLAYSTILGCGGAPAAVDDSDAQAGETGQAGSGDTGSAAGRAGASRGGGLSIGQGGTRNVGGQSSCTGNNCAGSAGEGTVCGDSVVAGSENCDDGNSIPGDGCNGNCRVESGGWLCETPGERCTTNLICGDNLAGPNEACDDGNTKSGDGCAADCTAVEEGWRCQAIGEPCVTTDTDPVCGNKAVEAGENCDDGNARAEDGCGGNCLREEGYICPAVGQPCEKDEFCGDGVRNETEECDDGNFVAGDCCSGACTLESNCACNDAEPQVCSTTIICGDGNVTGYEACDDGNFDAKDGCSADCNTVEPGYTCPAAGGACTVATEPCGNATLDGTEECDDGDTSSSDGCSSACEVETGWRCPTVGAACETILFCGDKTISFTRGETCDDGNTDNDDGCSEACKVETGYRCTGSPSVCVNTIVCGDRRVIGTETCDDGNTDDDDGCSANCALEGGWVCPAPGLPCRAAQCGDGLLVGAEECEFTTTQPPAGCSASCRIEAGYDCKNEVSTDGVVDSVCALTVCGNDLLERGEQCDEGANDLPFDGCFDCRREPECQAGVCASVCGDGQRYADEACDDGNSRDGDGCSASCTAEEGYYCEDIASAPATDRTLPVIVRDFIGKDRQDGGHSYHEDFNRHGGGGLLNLVQDSLDPNGRPAWRWTPYIGNNPAEASAGCSCDETAAFTCATETWDGRDVEFCSPPCSCTAATDLCRCDNTGHMYKEGGRANMSNPANFAQWYTNVDDVNLPLAYELGLVLDPATGNYVFDPGNDAFDPIGLGGWIAEGYETSPTDCTVTNVSFSTETHFWFEYAGGERFDFSGDDDTWVFVNGRLVIDLGGLHGRLSGHFTLDADTDGDGADTANGVATVSTDLQSNAQVALGLQPGLVYDVAMFQAERNQCGSNFKVTLKNFSKPRSECKSDCGDGIVAGDEACDLGTDASGFSLNTGDYGGCQSDCTLAAFCGDGKVNDGAGEVCDDGINAAPYGSGSGCAPGCILPPYCGDGNRDTDFGETCDLGEENSASAYGPEACLSDCQTAPFCGDALRNGGEICDDGVENGTPDSTCDTTCELKCGNGVLEAGEQCDEGSANNDGSYGGCRSNCKRAPYCGDGIKNGTEECDDGLNDGSYGTCEEGCTLAPYCGDRTVQEADGEVCDEGTTESSSEDYGEDICTARCLPGPFCGDGVVDTDHGEVCDDGDDNSATVAGACNLTCSGFIKPPVTCGNGKEDAGEECDEGTKNGTSGSACDLRCQLKCGNGFVEDGEECDDGTNDGTYGTCRSDCTLADYCGDGKKSGPELCDLGDDNEADPYGEGTCTLQCKQGPYCGDGRIDADNDEDCDGQVSCDTACSWAIPK